MGLCHINHMVSFTAVKSGIYFCAGMLLIWLGVNGFFCSFLPICYFHDQKWARLRWRGQSNKTGRITFKIWCLQTQQSASWLSQALKYLHEICK